MKTLSFIAALALTCAVAFSADVVAPSVTSASITPSSVNITNTVGSINITMQINDDDSGFSFGNLFLYNQAGQFIESIYFSDSDRTAGDSNSGVYQTTLTLPQGSEAGIWTFEVFLQDKVGNNQFKPVGSVAVNLPPGTEPTNFLAQAVDAVQLPFTTGGSGWILQNVDSHDGIDSAMSLPLANGDDRGWVDEVRFLQNSDIALPQIQNLRISPRSVNLLTGPKEVTLTEAVTNNGPIDMSDPVVTLIEVTPAQINTSNGSAQVQVTVAIQDDLSGIKDAYAYFYDSAGDFQAGFFTYLNGANRISGDNMAGTYQFSETLPQGSAMGRWEVGIYLQDMTGRAKSYGNNSSLYPEPFTGYFTISSAPLSTFAAYVASYSLLGGNALAGADPDHDGRNNATELLLGSNPKNAASNGAGLINTSRDATQFYLDFTINPDLTVTANGGFLELRDGGGGAPLKVKGQTQNGLAAAWASATPALISGNIFRVSVPFASGATGFARLYFETP